MPSYIKTHTHALGLLPFFFFLFFPFFHLVNTQELLVIGGLLGRMWTVRNFQLPNELRYASTADW